VLESVAAPEVVCGPRGSRGITMLQKTLKGNIFGGGSSHIETPKLVGLYKSGLLKIDDMVTMTYRLEDINSGYADMVEGKNIRGVITYDEADW
jgi:S-(hydroxymethyl)glutathione dehydrogenase / alcohol dehydrogenase